MGDAADYATEQGELALTLHATGQCGELGPCQYCEEEERKRRRMSTDTPLQAANQPARRYQ